MIRDINFLKPGDNNQPEEFPNSLIENLAKACNGRGCFTATIYHGDSEVIAKKLLDYLKPYNGTGKHFPLGGYMWSIEVKYKVVANSIKKYIPYSISDVIHTIETTFYEP